MWYFTLYCFIATRKYIIKVDSVEYLFGMYAKLFGTYCGTPCEIYVVGAKCVSKSLAASRRPMHDGYVLLCDYLAVLRDCDVSLYNMYVKVCIANTSIHMYRY